MSNLRVPRPPAIFPTSGIYRPPLAVTVSTDLADGDAIYYQVESEGSGSPAPKRQRYVAPFLLPSAGRFRVVSWVSRSGVGDSNYATAIYLLDHDGAPALVTTARPSALDDIVASRSIALHAHRSPPSELMQLKFARLPDAIRSLTAFDVDVELLDHGGFPTSAASLLHKGVRLVVSAELARSGRTSQVLVPVPEQCEAEKRAPPFIETTSTLIEAESASAGGCKIGRAGKSGPWNAFANSAPCLGGKLSSHTSVEWRVGCVSRVIVGLHTGVEDVASELSWRLLPYSFHFSADLMDPATVPAFRVYEFGKLVEAAGTNEFDINDHFALHIRPDGGVMYLHNHRLVHASTGDASAVYALHVRVAAQSGAHALTNLALVESTEPFIVRASNLLWTPPLEDTDDTSAVVFADDGHPTHLILRAWLTGVDFVPAVAKVPLVSPRIPRWAFAGISLASMFALGVVGCQSGKVVQKMSQALSEHSGIDRAPASGSTSGMVAGSSLVAGDSNAALWMTSTRGTAAASTSTSPRFVRPT